MKNREISRRDNSGELDLPSFETAILGEIEALGLPSEGILVPVRQRVGVLNQMGDVLEPVDVAARSKSAYLSKFMAAVAAGLFDAALNYLWDETVSSVRAKAAAYDLNYFFDQASPPGSELRSKLQGPDDMRLIDDQKLLLAANRIGLISDLGLQQLDLVRYMRNHASAAHPNHVTLRAPQLVGYLDACINEVINLPLAPSVLQVRLLLTKIKAAPIEQSTAAVTGGGFEEMPREQADNLALGLFGIYTRPGADTYVLENIRLLLPYLWDHVSEEARKQFGTKARGFGVNQQVDESALAYEFLESVGGQSYLPDDLRIPAIDAALDAVLAAHHSWSNFAAEGPPVRELGRLVGDEPKVPRAIQEKYATVLVYVFLTNGSGVSWSADPAYRELIGKFTTRESAFALNSITNRAVVNRLHSSLAKEKFKELLAILNLKVVSGARRDLYDALVAWPEADLDAAPTAPRIKRLLSEARRVRSTTRLIG